MQLCKNIAQDQFIAENQTITMGSSSENGSLAVGVGVDVGVENSKCYNNSSPTETNTHKEVARQLQKHDIMLLLLLPTTSIVF